MLKTWRTCVRVLGFTLRNLKSNTVSETRNVQYDRTTMCEYINLCITIETSKFIQLRILMGPASYNTNWIVLISFLYTSVLHYAE